MSVLSGFLFLCKLSNYLRPSMDINSHFDELKFLLGENAYVHSSHVTVIRFPDLLHHLLLCSRAGLDRALHCDGPLWVVQSQVLETGQDNGGRGEET